MTKAQPHPIPDVVADVAVVFVVAALVDGLGLLQAGAGISQQLNARCHAFGHRSDPRFT
jgi:hypothetical protein